MQGGADDSFVNFNRAVRCAVVSSPAGAQSPATYGPLHRVMQFKFEQNRTRGWTLMSDHGRTSHHKKMVASG